MNRTRGFNVWRISTKEWIDDRLIKDYIIFANGDLLHAADISLAHNTGFEDIHGSRLFEHDICGLLEESETVFEIIYEDGAYRKRYQNWNASQAKPLLTTWDIKNLEIELLGNIYENPELLTGGADV